MPDELLRKIGLSPGEIKVYSALLEMGRAPINRIHEATGIERRNIYDIINKLIERGLVSYVAENKKRFFHVAHPKNILGYLDQKKQSLETVEEEVKKQIPTLIEKYNFSKPAVNAEMFRGFDGVKAVWEDMLNYKEVRWIGSGRYVPIKFPNFFASWNRRRVQKKIKLINIFRYELRGELNHLLDMEYGRYLPKEFSGNPTVWCVYGNKVVNFMLGDEFFAFVIESRELADDYRKYQKYLWDHICLRNV
jgi:sugar-specific transcriptional regulator TrmB